MIKSNFTNMGYLQTRIYQHRTTGNLFRLQKHIMSVTLKICPSPSVYATTKPVQLNYKKIHEGTSILKAYTVHLEFLNYYFS